MPQLLMSIALLCALLSNAQGQETATVAVYKQHCAACHGAQRLGGMGPALLPQNLARLRPDAARVVIGEGRPASQMPAFGKVLSSAEIQALAEWIYTPPPSQPRWPLADIRDSHIAGPSPDPSAPPLFDTDLQNLFVVVELGDHHATVLDGDRFEPIHRFKTRFALHGGPKYSPDGRFVYFASRDGWISKYDLYRLTTVAEVRAGINTRNAAVSYDGRYVAVGNYLPHNVVILDAEDLRPIKVISTTNHQGTSSRVSAVYTAPTRHSFIVALKDLPELWEIRYDDAQLPLRRVALNDYLDDFFFDQDYRLVFGAARPLDGATAVASGQVVDLDAGRKVGELDLPGMPHLGSGITWNYQGRPVLASPNLKEGVVSVIDMANWRTITKIKTLGPGFFMRSHDGSPYAWVDVFFGPHHDKVHVIDKQTLQIVKTLQPAPGKTAAHVEFTRDGRYALLSIWDHDGAIVVYDAHTLEEIRRLPMNKPSGKYNVYNKTHYLAGTSH